MYSDRKLPLHNQKESKIRMEILAAKYREKNLYIDTWRKFGKAYEGLHTTRNAKREAKRQTCSPDK